MTDPVADLEATAAEAIRLLSVAGFKLAATTYAQRFATSLQRIVAERHDRTATTSHTKDTTP